MKDEVCSSEAVGRMAYGATEEAWGAFIWHCMYGAVRPVNKKYRKNDNGNAGD